MLLLLHFNSFSVFEKLSLSFSEELSLVLLLLCCCFSFIFLLNFLTLRTRVVLDPVLLLELLFSDRTYVEFVAHGTTSIHHLFSEKTTDKLKELVIVGSQAVIVVIETADTPSGSIHIKADNRTARRIS